jgi:hypothetical protein
MIERGSEVAVKRQAQFLELSPRVCTTHRVRCRNAICG